MILATTDTKGKIRYLTICLEGQEDGSFVIQRSSGLYKGKDTPQPDIVITEGKAKRTIEEQANLEYNALIKKAMDKGYIDVTTLPGYGKMDFNLYSAMPKQATNQNGIPKPMLCKVYDPDDSKHIPVEYFASYKLDGVRCFLLKKDGKLFASSRGGQDYNIAAKYILEDPVINQIFEDYPNIILDGELYHHGWNLQKISGLCRLESNVSDHELLEFHCYDIADETMSFWERLKLLLKINDSYESSRLHIVEHTQLIGRDLDTVNQSINELHDIAIQNGYEGIVIRDPYALYKFGARDRRMQKIKRMDTETFEIVGYELGLRGVEDMCFVMKTADDKIFKAKPEGDRTVKEEYMNNIDDLLGKGGDVRYFHLTPDGIPNLPVFVSPRFDIEV